MMPKSPTCTSENVEPQTSANSDKRKLKDSSPSTLKLVEQKKDPPNVEFLLRQVYFAHRSKVKDLELCLTNANQLVENLKEEIKGLKKLVTNLKNDKEDLNLANLQLKHQLNKLSIKKESKIEVILKESNSLEEDEIFVEENVTKSDDAIKLSQTKRRYLSSENHHPAKRTKIDVDYIDSPIFGEKVLSKKKIEFINKSAETIFALDTCDHDDKEYQHVVDHDVILVPETLCIDDEQFHALEECSKINQNVEEKKLPTVKKNSVVSQLYLKPLPAKCLTNSKKLTSLKTPLLFKDILEKSAGNNSSLLNVSDDISPVLVKTDMSKKELKQRNKEKNHIHISSSKLAKNNVEAVIASLFSSTKTNSPQKQSTFDEAGDLKCKALAEIGNCKLLVSGCDCQDFDETFCPVENETECKGTKLLSKISPSPHNLPENKNVVTKSPKFKFIEKAIRNHYERKKLEGFTCKECQQFYAHLPEEEYQKHMKECSRHRAKFIPPGTPEHYWSIDFPDTAECRNRGYINTTQKKPLLGRRKRPLKKL